MTPRKLAPPRQVTDRTVTAELHIPGRSTIERGTEVTVAGIGRCVFSRHVVKGEAEWIDVTTARGFSRTVRPDRITRVHRTRRIV